MMKNTLVDLNNHLFAELERLGDEELSGDELEVEIERAKAISSVANQAVNNAKLVLDAYKFNDERLDLDKKAPAMLTGNRDD